MSPESKSSTRYSRSSWVLNGSQTIPLAVPDLSERERRYYIDAFDSGWISSIGTYVEQFETQFARFAGADYAVSCCNGTAALHLAMMALDLGPGDEVIVPDLTYVASANAVRYVGATPVFADVDPRSWTMDPNSVQRLMTKQTRAILAVHLFSVPADMSALRALADHYHCALIQDVAETPGAAWAGRPVASWGDIATFSFYGNKILTTGEGGMVCTSDARLAARVRKLHAQGYDPNRIYWFDEVGYNYRMTHPAAALGLAQLERIDELMAKRRQVRTWYDTRIAPWNGLLTPQWCPPSAGPVDWMYGLTVEPNAAVDRDQIRTKLAELGIETRPFFHPLHLLPPYRGCRTDGQCPVSQRVAGGGIMLPTHTRLTESDVDFVVTSLISSISEIATLAGASGLPAKAGGNRIASTCAS